MGEFTSVKEKSIENAGFLIADKSLSRNFAAYVKRVLQYYLARHTLDWMR